MGWLFAGATGALAFPPPQLSQASAIDNTATVDIVPDNYQLAQELYVQNCSTCHIAIPPQVLSTETWRQLLQDPEHYGQKLKLPTGPQRLLIWNYLQTFSRLQPKTEEVAYRMASSRYFKALHPRVKRQDFTVSSCVTCHPGASQYNFRQLTPEWENSP